MATKRGSPASRPKHATRVDVDLWGQHVGAVALDPSSGFYAFAYTEEFAQQGIEPAPIFMPARSDEPYLFPDLSQSTFRRLPALLSDALPDDFGNALINAWMASQGTPTDSITSLDRLAYMASRGMGALTFRPAKGPARKTPFVIEMKELVEEARMAVHDAGDNDVHAAAAFRHLIDVGTSAGGARAKAVIAWNPRTREILSGGLAAPGGFEHWLLKFDGMGGDSELGMSQGYGRIEYAYHLMATEAGMTMMPCHLLEEDGRAHFMTQRFDRGNDDSRHHIQTLCAMAHLDYRFKETNAYAQLFQTLRRLDMPYEQFEEAFRRMAFNVMGKNCDDHTKNFSFRLRQGHAWELAPAYDVSFAHNPKGEWTRQHLMSVNGKFRDFTREDLLAEADRFGIGTASQVLDRIRAAIEQWPRFADEAGVAPDARQSIGRLHLRL